MDFAHGSDSLSVGARVPLGDLCHATTVWVVRRYDKFQTQFVQDITGLYNPTDADFARNRLKPYRATRVVGNLITNAGWTRLMNLLTNQGGTQALTASAVRIGVGTGTTAEAYTDNDLSGASKFFQPVTGAGSLGTRQLTFTASFGGSDANFAWNEFGLDVGTPTVTAGSTVNALLFNHKANVAQGSKASGQTWTATATLSFT